MDQEEWIYQKKLKFSQDKKTKNKENKFYKNFKKEYF